MTQLTVGNLYDSLFVMMIKLLTACKIPLLADLRPDGWQDVLVDALGFFEPFLHCPSLRLCSIVYKDMIVSHGLIPPSDEDTLQLLDVLFNEGRK